MLQQLMALLNKKSEKPSAVPHEINKDAFDFETSIAYITHESEKRAWRIAIIAIALAFILALALVFLMPLKSAVPYVIRYDATTGYTDIMTSVTEQNIEINEAVSKYFVSNYVTLREGYYYETLQRDYNLVQIFGSESVNEEYKLLYSGKNSRDTINGARVLEKVHVVSVVIAEAAQMKTANVRIKILTYDKTNMKNPPHEKNKVVTLAFQYTPNAPIGEFQRLNNPLGFKVVTYRVDNEISR